MLNCKRAKAKVFEKGYELKGKLTRRQRLNVIVREVEFSQKGQLTDRVRDALSNRVPVDYEDREALESE